MHDMTVIAIIILISICCGAHFLPIAGAAAAVYYFWQRDVDEPFDGAPVASGGITALPDVAPVFDNTETIRQMMSNKPYQTNEITDGDTRIAEHMHSVGQKAQEAVLHRARFTSDNFRMYFQEELDQQERRDWWEEDDLDDQMIKDGVIYT
jgi:hypothetical protein